MIKQDLSGKWNLQKANSSGEIIRGKLPGCNYIDLMESGLLPDVFYGTNEYDARWVGETDWEYSRDFFVNEHMFVFDYIFLKISGVDTAADIFVNGKLVDKTNNIHIDYFFDIKNLLKNGENKIKILFHSPIKYVNNQQKMDSYPHNFMGITGFPHMRKAAYHFGWDWGPVLPPSGVNGEIAVYGYSKGYIQDAKIIQKHKEEKVSVEINVDVVKNVEKDFDIQIKLFDPEGKEIYSKKTQFNESIIEIRNPELWQSNGRTDRKKQPLYRVEIELFSDEELLDKKSFEIGLRTIVLDTSEDEYGTQFAFVVNGKRIFAKGANWIPADSFVSRLTDEKLEYHIKSVADANMNMIRVWGGGFYESDRFYELCDKYGILVWQDFAFACNPYPFYNSEFLENVKKEVESVVKRIRHHASLALWCGNNELEMMSLAWRHKKRHMESTKMFFYDILPKALAEYDNITPYWYGSPSGGEYMKNINADGLGDTHLWHVWHGLMPFDYYHKRFTRFCSEFGFESMPDMDTIKTFCEEKDFSLYSEVMLSHQKCKSGNQKILYYMVDNFKIPKRFSDLVYMSQLTQAESIKYAVEHWRRNAGRCNGALFWQLNDCWPTLSWSSIDYLGRWKALQYYSKRFFEPVTISIRRYCSGVKIFAINEKLTDFEGQMEWTLSDFDGKIFGSGKSNVVIASNNSHIEDIKIPSELIAKEKNNIFMLAVLRDKEGKEISRNTFFFVKTRKLNLKKAEIEYDIVKKDDNYEITLWSNTFAKNVCLKVENQQTPFSDNFFDLAKGERKAVKFEVKGDINIAESLEIICYNNIERKHSRLMEKMIKLRIALKPYNIISRIVHKFI